MLSKCDFQSFSSPSVVRYQKSIMTKSAYKAKLLGVVQECLLCVFDRISPCFIQISPMFGTSLTIIIILCALSDQSYKFLNLKETQL